MTTVAELAQKVRAALAVNAEYEAVTIPSAIRRVMKRLLRDYNFPKSVKRYMTNGPDGPFGVEIGAVAHAMPPGFKRPLEVRFYYPAEGSWTNRLERREGFALPISDDDVDSRYGRYYWLEGNNLVIDTPMPVNNLKLVVWYQSMLLDAEAVAWLLDDMEDLIFTSSVVRAAAELRKAEAMQAFAPLLQEEMQSIAIYANELEWNGVGMQMREPRGLPTPRYPAGGTL